MKPESARVKAWRDSKKKPCPGCGKPIHGDSKTCPQCQEVSWSRGDLTLKEATYDYGNRAEAYALVRSRARTKLATLGWTRCIGCGYDKHVEAAHRKAISSYPEETLLSVINAEENLAPLCPNCHWEFDHGMLNLVGAVGYDPT